MARKKNKKTKKTRSTSHENLLHPMTAFEMAVDAAFDEPGAFTVEHVGYGKIVLSTRRGTRVVAIIHEVIRQS